MKKKLDEKAADVFTKCFECGQKFQPRDVSKGTPAFCSKKCFEKAMEFVENYAKRSRK